MKEGIKTKAHECEDSSKRSTTGTPSTLVYFEQY